MKEHNVKTTNYKALWECLRLYLSSKLDYHKSGYMQSVAESIEGTAFCTEVLDRMDELESKHLIKEGVTND